MIIIVNHYSLEQLRNYDIPLENPNVALYGNYFEYV